MATLVAFHAHPVEAIGSGGTLAKAAADGHRVVLVVATRGERGHTPPGLLAPGQTLGQRRVAETLQAAGILGVHRVGVRAAQLVPVVRVYEGTISRSRLQRLASHLAAIGASIDGEILGTPDEAIHHHHHRRAPLPAAQAPRDGCPRQPDLRNLTTARDAPEIFEQLWGHEDAIPQGAPPGFRETNPFPCLRERSDVVCDG